MSTKLTAGLTLAVAIVATVVSVAGAEPQATKQRVAFEMRKSTYSFVLVPLSRGATKSDAGPATYGPWSSRTVLRDGQEAEINELDVTLAGKRGTLVIHLRNEWSDAGSEWAIGGGRWTVVRGTGAYRQLAGGGRVAAVWDPADELRPRTWRWEGYLTPR
jgi:hypothetical protein